MEASTYFNLEEEQYDPYFDMVNQGLDYLEIKKAINKDIHVKEEASALLDAIDEAIVAYNLKKDNLLQSKAMMFLAIALVIPAAYAVYKFGWDRYAIVPVGLLILAGIAYRQSKRLRKEGVRVNQGRTIRTFKKFDRF